MIMSLAGERAKGLRSRMGFGLFVTIIARETAHLTLSSMQIDAASPNGCTAGVTPALNGRSGLGATPRPVRRGGPGPQSCG